MKILSIGNFTTGWDGSICDEEHIAGALEELGHEVLRQQRGEPYTFNGLDKYDFILMAQWDGYLETEIEDLKRYLHAPVVYWAFDYQADGQEWHERLIAEADLYLSKPISDSKYPNWRWLSQDFAPRLLWDNPMFDMPKQDIEVLFTGSWVPWESGRERVSVLREIDKKYDLHIYGVTPDQWKAEGFKNVHGPAVDGALPPLVRRAKINFSMDHVYAPGYWSDRTAQIMVCMGFALFRYVPLAEVRFWDHLTYFYNTQDCLDKIDYYLTHEEERKAMAAEGYNQALATCTPRARVKELLTIVKSIL